MSEPLFPASNLHQPAPDAPRLEWMAWEHAWQAAALRQDIHALAALAGEAIDSPEKHVACQKVFSAWCEQPRRLDNKLFRLLLRKGARPDASLAVGLCAAGRKTVQMMLDAGIDIGGQDPCGRSALSVAIGINNENERKRTVALIQTQEGSNETHAPTTACGRDPPTTR